MMLQMTAVQRTDLDDASFTHFLSVDAIPGNMSLEVLEKHCMIEIDRYYHESICKEEYGLEMFRRATMLHDPFAWEALQRCFSGVTRAWLRRHSRWEMDCAIDSEENY